MGAEVYVKLYIYSIYMDKNIYTYLYIIIK